MNRIEGMRKGVSERGWRKMAGTIMGLTAILLSVSCGEDPPPPPAGPQTYDLPEIPTPRSYFDHSIPTTSEEMIVETARLTDFRPILLEAINQVNRREDAACADGAFSNPDCACDVGGLGVEDPWLLRDGEIVADLEAQECLYWPSRETESQVPLKPLSERPHLQLVRYWERGAQDCWYVDGCSSRAIEWSHTYGVTRTEAEEFGKTIGASVGFQDPWQSVKSTLSAEFSYRVSSSIAVSEVDTVTNSRSIECPCNKSCVFCVWQLIDEYRYVDEEGEMFSDPNFVFDYEFKAQHFQWTGEVLPRADEHTQNTLFDR